MDWVEAQNQIADKRAQIINELLQFAINDVVLFWSDDLDVQKEQELCWRPVIKWLNQMLGFELKITKGFDAPHENALMLSKLKAEFETLSDKELTALYAAAKDMRSVLLAFAMIKGFISAKRAFELSELEELYQVKRWGSDPLAQERRDALLKALVEIEKYLKS